MHVSYGRQLVRSGFGRTGLAIFGLLAVVALVCPFLVRDPHLQTVQVLEAPSAAHLLGTNDVGQDLLARLLCGARTSVLVALCAGAASTFIAAVVGVSAGLIGGLYEKVVMRLVDALLVIPAILVLILVAAYVEPTMWGLIVLISVLQWQGGARIVRAQTLSLKERAHVSAAKTFGAGGLHVACRHVLPDLAPILVVSFVHRARRAVFMAAGLAFIGIADPTMVSWGTMIRHALDFYYLPAWKWWLLPPGICLSLLILSFLFMGHSLEKAMDPRLRDA